MDVTMKIKNEEKQKIADEYSNGKKTADLAARYCVASSTISLIVKEILGSQRKRLTDKELSTIQDGFKNGKSLKELAKEFNCATNTISNILEKTGLRQKSDNGKHKGGFSVEQKEQIIDLYMNQHRGKDYIAKIFERSDCCISYWLKKWKVETISRSEISTKIRNVYGPTKGFSEKSHTNKSKEKTAKSMRANWQKGEREVTIGNSRTYNTIIGKVLGKFEVAYIQLCKETDRKLPEICHKRYKTPFGTYKPDFFHNEKFIEIKSKFTLCVAKGQYHNNKGKYSDLQWKKICYFMENISPLDVIVIDGNEAQKLFLRAKEDILINAHLPNTLLE